MHYVLANQWYPPESGWGGVAMWNYAMARAYRELGHKVTVISSRISPEIPARRDENGITVLRLQVRDAYWWRRLFLLGRYLRPIQQLQYAWRVNQAVRGLHRDHQVDLVEFAEVNAEGFFYARNPLTPVVVRCHTPTFVLRRYYAAREMPFDTSVISWCEKDLIHRAHALTAPSNDMARVIASESSIPYGDIAVIPNALNSDEWQEPSAGDLPTDSSASEPPNRLSILYVGRLERAKGVAILAQAIPLVLRAFPKARFVFVGDDRPTGQGTTHRAELERQFALVGVSSQVQFTHAVDHPTLLNWYRRADICVVPSILYESFSYTCAQGMAAGRPVVASRIGGIPETIQDGVTGILCEPGEAEQLADSIIRLGRDPELRTRMGRAGREKVAREFDALKVARRNLLVYEQAQESFKRRDG